METVKCRIENVTSTLLTLHHSQYEAGAIYYTIPIRFVLIYLFRLAIIYVNISVPFSLSANIFFWLRSIKCFEKLHYVCIFENLARKNTPTESQLHLVRQMVGCLIGWQPVVLIRTMSVCGHFVLCANRSNVSRNH